MEILGWLIFLFALMISVMLHETGHFITAKKFGMKCTRYFLGFGPTIWSIWLGETEYGVKALPFGGFVKIEGMTSMDEVDPADEPRTFRRAPGWQRLIVLAAGSFMHFVFAAFLIFILAIGIGIENNTTQLSTVSACVPATLTAYENSTCAGPDAKSPALLAGLKVGDTITSFDGIKTPYWTDLQNAILAAKPGQRVTLTAERDGRTLTLRTTIAEVPGHGSYFGILPTNAIVFQHPGLLGAISYVGTGFSETVSGSVSALGRIPSALPYLFNKQERASTSAGDITSIYGAARDTGEAVAAAVGWQYKVNFVLLLIASLNIFVGILNMLPLLPMDGGHFAVVLWERVRARFARLRHRPDPGMVDYRKLIPVSFGVFVILVVFGVMLIAADIVNPVNIG